MSAAETPGAVVRLDPVSLAGLLEALEAPVPSPCGGSAAAIAGAMGASLVTLVAHQSRSWAEAPGIAAQATALRDRLAVLADEDADAFAAALEALHAAESSGGSRDRLLGVALARAADVPLQIAAAAADVSELGSLAAANGSPALRPDAVTATVLAEAAARAAAQLVATNLASLPGDTRDAEAASHAAAAARARAAALSASEA